MSLLHMITWTLSTATVHCPSLCPVQFTPVLHWYRYYESRGSNPVFLWKSVWFKITMTNLLWWKQKMDIILHRLIVLLFTTDRGNLNLHRFPQHYRERITGIVFFFSSKFSVLFWYWSKGIQVLWWIWWMAVMLCYLW